MRWLGTLSTRVAICVLLVAALIGVLGTLLTGSEPGKLLSYLLIIGSVLAALGIRRRSLHLLIPLPALAFFVCAVLTGWVKDSDIDTSKTELGLTFLQWIAGVFFAMCAATILVLLIGAGRWLLSRQLVAGGFGISSGAARGDVNAPHGTPAPRQRTDRDRRRPTARGPRPGSATMPAVSGQIGRVIPATRGEIAVSRPVASRPTPRSQAASPPPARSQAASLPAGDSRVARIKTGGASVIDGTAGVRREPETSQMIVTGPIPAIPGAAAKYAQDTPQRLRASRAGRIAALGA